LNPWIQAPGLPKPACLQSSKAGGFSRSHAWCLVVGSINAEVNLLERQIHSQRVAQISISTIGPSQVEQSKGQLFRSPLSMPLQVKTLRLHWHWHHQNKMDSLR
jgi:hypothetical protein